MHGFKPLLVIPVGLGLSACTESLYLTTPKPVDNKPGYVFVAPYFAKVDNKITVAIVPPPPPKDATTPAGPPTLTITLIPVPVTRSYLYFSKNGSFNNSFNVSVGADGLLTSSDSTSVQQITAILTELGQTAAAFVAPELRAPPPATQPTAPSDDPSFCAAAIAKLTASVALYRSRGPIQAKSESYEFAHTVIVGQAETKTVRLFLTLKLPDALATEAASGQPDVSAEHAGFVAYMPAPTVASVTCKVGGGEPLTLSQPAVLSTYFTSRYLDPQRDLLTNPAETFTLNEGFLTGHKYSDQSSAKTVVDTITAPIRALMPSVSVQQTSQLQTGGGKPDQTTTTTQTTTGPPKGP